MLKKFIVGLLLLPILLLYINCSGNFKSQYGNLSSSSNSNTDESHNNGDGLPPGTPVPSGDPTKLPLVQSSQIEYVGGFKLPQTNTEKRFGYGGMGAGYYKDPTGKETLYMQGHAWYPGQVAQVQIPATINANATTTATLLQGFNDITDGKLGGVDGDQISAIMPYNGRLIVSSSIYYDASGSQQGTIGVSDFDLAKTNDFQGFFGSVGINPGRLGKYMTTVPVEWRSLLGAPAMNGACCMSIISRTNAGPGISLFDPDTVGSGTAVNFKEVIGYSSGNPIKFKGLQGGCDIQSTVFNCTTSVAAVAFPAKTRSVLFFGIQGTGPMCYKDAGPVGCRGTGGYHAPPYKFQVWAFDANDILAVKNGSKTPSDIEPYAIWELPYNYQSIESGTFDPETNRLFLVQGGGEDPIVRVFKINVP